MSAGERGAACNRLRVHFRCSWSDRTREALSVGVISSLLPGLRVAQTSDTLPAWRAWGSLSPRAEQAKGKGPQPRSMLGPPAGGAISAGHHGVIKLRPVRPSASTL